LGLKKFLPRLAWNMIVPISASKATTIIGLSHHGWSSYETGFEDIQSAKVMVSGGFHLDFKGKPRRPGNE
jgi:hypothetical protein